MSRWIVQDWAGNRIWPDRDFDSFDDGWDALYEAFGERGGETLGEYYVVPERGES